MSLVLLDTHVWAWSLLADDRLSAGAIEAINSAETVLISAISFYEIGQKIRLGKWPEMAPYHFELVDLAALQGITVLDVSAAASLAASILDWTHRDPFDRIIGATALVEDVALVSADVAFDDLKQLNKWPGRIW
ncbi:type II toxin-antitoxin system VapC family toxin [Devosia sp.]|uniref:type II toxin-antitoxin system VapC family toxin n=1 Tax=Devosia sp. TaxID=1871048 RepID=UPI001AD1EC7E|nr:type II toxin-antitoxin system VapC family toxin [Devosia sp.]MBN9334839.1 type II toxin-antitoxin system VapC family toxin [Devosia sp.]